VRARCEAWTKPSHWFLPCPELNVDLQLIGIDGGRIVQAIEDFQGSDPKAPMNKCVEPDKEALAVAFPGYKQ
jgi:hypothetical protein